MHLTKLNSKKFTWVRQTKLPTKECTGYELQSAKLPIQVFIGKFFLNFSYYLRSIVDKVNIKFYIMPNKADIWVVWISPLQKSFDNLDWVLMVC